MDELQQRRHAGARARAAEARGAREDDEEEEEEEVRFGWIDVLALTIAAFQIILPILFLFFAVIALVYLIFKWVFT